MLFDVTPRKLQNEIDLSRKRLAPFRKARYHFLRSYVGQYYNTDRWCDGDEPINLIFNAIRVLVPNIVMNYPKAVISSDLWDQRDYGELLGLALDKLAHKIRLKTTLRRWIVDSLFGLGIIKVGLCTSQTLWSDGGENDPGVVITQPYADNVDFDDWVMDSTCRRREEAAFVGHHHLVDRRLLLEAGTWDNALIEGLPSVMDTMPKEEVRELSRSNRLRSDIDRLQNMVNVCELWVPSEKAIFMLPGHLNAAAPDTFLQEPQGYYGLDEGPFVYLSVTPDVPDNPLPIVPVGIWQDLHTRANEMMVKVLEQAGAQRDILLYPRGQADDADAIRTAENLEMLAVDDPSVVQQLSLGGQNPKNMEMLGTLMMFFSQMAGNIEQLAGNRSDADSATQASILQGNAMVTVEDMRDLAYDGTAEIYRRLGWYLHTDPLIQVPLIRRVTDENGQINEEPVTLTAEQRRGDFFDFTFKIELRSMSRLDPQNRIKNMMTLLVNVMPAVANSALILAQLGRPLDAQKIITQAAHELGLDWMDDAFGDEKLLERFMFMQALAGPMQNSQGQVGSKQTSAAGAMQNNGNPMAQAIPSIGTEQRQNAQAGANPMQAVLKQGV